MKIGAQLFTVRDFCKNTDDFAQTLSKIANIGYKYVQVSGTCAFEAEWLKKELAKNGLECALTHTPKDRLISSTEDVICDHKVFDCKYIGLGYHKFSEDIAGYNDFVKTYHPIAKKIADGERYFMYHNHASEFIKFEGKTILEHMAEDFSSEHMGFTVDCYWVQVGGADPADGRRSARSKAAHQF